MASVLVVIGFFAWVQLLPTFKFLWAPLLDRYDVPGFARFWGKRRGWIMLSQLGIFLLDGGDGADLVGREPAADRLVRGPARLLDDDARGRRRRLAHRAGADPGGAGAGRRRQSVGLSHRHGRGGQRRIALRRSARLGLDRLLSAIAAGAFVPFPILAAMRPEPDARRQPRPRRWRPASPRARSSCSRRPRRSRRSAGCCSAPPPGIGISGQTNVTPFVLGICMVPFLSWRRPCRRSATCRRPRRRAARSRSAPMSISSGAMASWRSP